MKEQQDVLNKKLDAFIGHAQDDQLGISPADKLPDLTIGNPPLNAPQEIAAEVPSAASESETPNLSAGEPEELSNIFNLMFTKFNLTKDELYKISCQSCSEGNFCLKLVTRIFLKDGLHGKNCDGKRGSSLLININWD